MQIEYSSRLLFQTPRYEMVFKNHIDIRRVMGPVRPQASTPASIGQTIYSMLSTFFDIFFYADRSILFRIGQRGISAIRYLCTRRL